MDMDAPPPLVRDAIQRCYESLANAVLNAARARGYGGDDVQAAAALLATPDRAVRRLCEVVGELARQRGQDTPAIVDALQGLGDDQIPPPRVAVSLAEALLHQRQNERRSTVNQAISSTDHDRLGLLLASALAEMGETVAADTPAHRLLGQLVKRYRLILNHTNQQAESHRKRLAEVFSALQRVVSGERPDVDKLGEDGLIINGLYDMLSGRRALADRARSAEEALSHAQHQLHDQRLTITRLQQEVEQLAAQGDEDERLQAYREAFARWEKGEDPRELLEAIRDRERVFVASRELIEETLRLLDRSLDNAVNGLHGLRRLAALGPDPKRYRPRLLGKSPYQLRHLPGMLSACRDCAADVTAFAARLRWADGIGRFVSQLRKLRPAMQEMVRLVADYRERAGDRVTMSLTVNMATVEGLASLPALLAADLQSLARSRKGKSFAAEILPLCDELVGAYHHLLAQAIDDLDEIPEGSKRERPAAALTRLANHLELLAQLQERHYHGASDHGFELSESDRALLSDRDLLRRAAGEIAAMVEICGQLPGAPDRDDLPPAPRLSSSDTQIWHRYLDHHQRWLSEAARYRVQERESL